MGGDILDNTIYCYTGTGNSLEAANTVASVLGDTVVIPMSDRRISDDNPVVAEMIGFVFPVHHWTIPRKVREFVSDMEINTNAYIFVIAACGGIAVNALNDFNQLIISKGAKISYAAVHKNVSSYIVAYERFPDPAKQVPKSQIALQKIADDVKKRVCKSAPKGNPFKYLLRFVMSGAAKKFPNMDRNFVVSDQCVGCATCNMVCPAENIRLENGKPVFLHKCEQCMACIQYCPCEAINYKDKTQNRSRYHHPNISAEDIAAFRKKCISQ